ncbi:hypothetical protein GLOTRDRAFT_109851 [Gloeophyllum trabeum ATCC 11539]|uniref:Fungal-type protein kinase domain-containing protein n=1 Tax=Gloeophyllum trabeum (strain ATCC 11539 / FP-39264 / Madison 617) TaxID=670483 RepID=S7QKL9_GLOTA|nr:uncharacterized protein GLOTRDRAFT_109851 [Gloeophyllum trabeum ATCC 11539]EPQ59798.1 hypothetical protein GLOTRDRAFT_109851 [Gloeophyllum trabeum ATCC 11539]
MKALYDSIEAHEVLANSGEVHGNIDLNTILTDEHRPGDAPRSQRGYLFDYEHPRRYAVSLPGLEDVNWRAMVSSLPAMRNYMPALVEQIRGMQFQEESNDAGKT